MRLDACLDDRSNALRRLFHDRLEQRQLIGIELLAPRTEAGPHELGDVVLELRQLARQRVNRREMLRDEFFQQRRIVRQRSGVHAHAR